MIARIWHGWTTPENADAYEKLLRDDIFEGIASRRIAGYRGIELLRSDGSNEVSFITIMHFDSLEAVVEFAGAEYERAVIPPEALKLLSRFDARSAHYQVCARREVQ